jgi:Transglycosylase SLT domain
MRIALWFFLFCAVSGAVRGTTRAEPSDAVLCEQAISTAGAAGHTPPGMVAAIAQVESGRPDPGGGMRPWPWTIDANGVGQFFATKAQAVAAVAALQARGVRSIDVGCMQVNLMHHPDAFTSLDQAFDPAANTAYAVRFLNALYRRTGSWPAAIAAYHSDTPHIAADYQRRVLANWHHQVPTAVTLGPSYIDSGLIYGAFGSTGRVYGQILPDR